MPRNELYVGNLTRDVGKRDLESAFERYGRLLRCDLKNRGYGSIYAFMEFEEERDAEDALKAENGKDMCGASMVVEWAKAKGGRDRFSGRNSFAIRGGRSLECYECGEKGHFARECRSRRGSGRNRMRHRSRSRTRSRSRSRRRDRSRSRDKSRDRSRDKSRDRSRDKSRERRRRTRTKSKSKSRGRSISRSPSRAKTRSRSPSYSRDKSREASSKPE